MRKFLFIIFVCLFNTFFCFSQNENKVSQTKNRTKEDIEKEISTLQSREYSKEYLDTVNIKKTFIINDYSMIGVEYGVGLHAVLFNPSKKFTPLFTPVNVGVLFTSYGKMFGYMPYFGIQTGFYYNHQGYKFRKPKNPDDYMPSVDGATKSIMRTVEIPILAQLHYDLPHFKIMLTAGIFGAYRLDVRRWGEGISEEFSKKYLKTDHRFDYGLRGGLGFALVFTPFEIHLNAMTRFSWGSLYDADYYSTYYYRYANPLDLYVNIGLHMHLSKRVGKSKKRLKKEAYDIVFPEQVLKEQLIEDKAIKKNEERILKQSKKK